MTFTIDGYEVEIKAKGFSKERFNKADTMAFANHLSIMLSRAGDYYESDGYKAIAESIERDVDNIYNKLDSYGYYDECRK